MNNNDIRTLDPWETDFTTVSGFPAICHGPKINFSRAKKNPSTTSEASPKVVETKLLLKSKSPSPAEGVVIRELLPNTGRPATEEIVGKRKGKVDEPPQKVKHTFVLNPLSSRTNQLGSSAGEKRPLEGGSNSGRASLVKK
ncbi:hypothetical protein Fot_32112 [Forsythia ovata]|uniref:Uncharacterized protein n=1 Tax=Forsythia ovata TaxID=205694 RepID=A0ABD1T6Z5_9LAMI